MCNTSDYLQTVSFLASLSKSTSIFLSMMLTVLRLHSHTQALELRLLWRLCTSVHHLYMFMRFGTLREWEVSSFKHACAVSSEA